MCIIILFILINFIVSSISDIVIQHFAFKPNANSILKSLIPYYNYYGKTTAILLAGLTVCCILIIHLFLFKLIFNVYLPTRSTKLIIYFLILTLILGYIADYLIKTLHIFGNTLNSYYKIKTAHLWGMMAYFFSIIISYIILSLYMSLI
jgi:hypothetical protein